MPSKVVLDANVLYSARLRDLWMEIGVGGLIALVWTDRIEAEWISAVLRSRPELETHLRRTAAIMRDVLPDVCVLIYPLQEIRTVLPDDDDSHVVAAAITCRAKTIVTHNVRDFPSNVLGPLGIEAISPDAMLLRLAASDEEGLLAAIASVRARLQTPPMEAGDYAAGFSRAGCPGIAGWMNARTDKY